jgi:hypothetical protein
MTAQLLSVFRWKDFLSLGSSLSDLFDYSFIILKTSRAMADVQMYAFAVYLQQCF